MSAGAPNNPLARHGGLSYLHIPTSAPERSASFYEHTLGWKIERRDNGVLRFADPSGLLIGGFSEETTGSGYLPYFYVNDLDAAVARGLEDGGTLEEAIRPEGDILVAQLREPGGCLLGLWQFIGG